MEHEENKNNNRFITIISNLAALDRWRSRIRGDGCYGGAREDEGEDNIASWVVAENKITSRSNEFSTECCSEDERRSRRRVELRER